MVGKNLTVNAVRLSKMCWPQLTANWNTS